MIKIDFRKLVIGFGFLVPDVAFNEAYVSFLLVHPDWQRAGIGSFMLYHLIQVNFNIKQIHACVRTCLRFAQSVLNVKKGLFNFKTVV